jgi:hypothetical protein
MHIFQFLGHKHLSPSYDCCHKILMLGQIPNDFSFVCIQLNPAEASSHTHCFSDPLHATEVLGERGGVAPARS